MTVDGGVFRLVARRAIRVLQYIAGFENWLTCLHLRSMVGRPSKETRIVCLRNGLQMKVRVGTPDICILWEVFVGGAYKSAESLLGAGEANGTVVDLGGNIGAFAIRIAHSSPDITVHSYEPGPQNAEVFRENLQLNPKLAPRVKLFEEAASGFTGRSVWYFEPGNPGGSSLYGQGEGFAVSTASMGDILDRCETPLALLKMDIEGAEYAILEGTALEAWEAIPAMFVELHADPSQRSSPAEWLAEISHLGFSNQRTELSTILLSRA